MHEGLRDALLELRRLVVDPTLGSDERVRELREMLHRGARDAPEAPLPSALRPGSESHRQWFAEAVLLWTRFADVGRPILVETRKGEVGRFPVDLDASGPGPGRIRQALQRGFDWQAAELVALERRVAQLTSNLEVKRAITRRLATELGDGSELLARVARLFRELYGVPVRAGDVDLTLVPTTLVFALPFEGERPQLADFAARPQDERRAIESFLADVAREDTPVTSRFPAFGHLDPARISPRLLERLARGVRETPELGGVPDHVVASTLQTMVVLVPRRIAEAFVIHDIWGHGWQESLCEFEWPYADLLHVDDPLEPETASAFCAPDTPALETAFRVAAGEVVLHAAGFERIVAEDLRGRIRAGLNSVVSECLADLVEHKFECFTDHDEPVLPSSSRLRDAPLRLDLTLRDVIEIRGRWSRPYWRWLAQPEESERWQARLRRAGLPESGLADALASARALVRERFAAELAPPPSEPAGSRSTQLDLSEPAGSRSTQLDLVDRAALCLASWDAALEDALAHASRERARRHTELGPHPAWRSPATCIDLWVLTSAWCYEQDRDEFFWHLPGLLRSALPASLERLQSALDRIPPVSPPR